MSDVEQNTDGNEEIKIDESIECYTAGRKCTFVLLKSIFSPIGLVLLVSLYSIMGAIVFPILEKPNSITKDTADILKSREDCLRELWTITEKLNVLYEKNWTMLVHDELRKFEGTIVDATKRNLRSENDQRPSYWTFSEALLYSVTLITTIGHGSLTPKSTSGKLVTMLYALIGVPLMLMCLSSLGGLLATALQNAYQKICCSQKNNTMEHTCSEQLVEMDCRVCRYDKVCSTKSIPSYECKTNKNISNTGFCENSNSETKKSPYKQLNTQPFVRQYVLITDPVTPTRNNLQARQSVHDYRTLQYPRRTNLNTEYLELKTNMPTLFPIITSNNQTNYKVNQSDVKYFGQQPSNLPTDTKNRFIEQMPTDHTATIHGIRRGRTLQKPMSYNINSLRAESEITSANNTLEETKSNTCKKESIDIMEDEAENEYNRTGCPHGTPSRIPLISSQHTKMTTMDTEDDMICKGNTQENNLRQIPITIVLLILISYIIFGTVIFSIWEGWSFVDGAFFCFVTLSTIGLGDYFPQQTVKGPEIQLFACCAYLLLGLVLVAMSLNILETQLVWKCKRIAVRLKLAKV